MTIKKIVLTILSTFLIIFIGIYVFLHTQYGKNIIINIIITNLKSQGIEAKIGNLRSDILNKIEFENISFRYKIKNQYIVNLLSKNIKIKYLFWELFSKNIKFKEIAFDSPIINFDILKNINKKNISSSTKKTSNNFSIVINNIVINNGKLNLYSNLNRILESNIKGNFSLTYPDPKVPSQPIIQNTLLNISIPSINQKKLLELAPLLKLPSDLEFEGRAFIRLKGNLYKSNIVGDLSLSKFNYNQYKSEKIGLFFNCNYEKDTKLEIKNIGMMIDNNSFSAEGDLFLNKPIISYDIKLKILQLKLSKYFKNSTDNFQLNSPIIFHIKGQGYKKDNIFSQITCSNTDLNLNQDLKINSLNALININHGGIFIDKFNLVSNFGNGEVRGFLLDYKYLDFDYVLSNSSTPLDLKLSNGTSIKGIYRLDGKAEGKIWDSTKFYTKINIENFTFDSSSIKSLKGEISLSNKNKKISILGEKIHYNNLYSKNFSIYIQSDTTFDSAYIATIEFKNNKFPKSTVDTINGKIYYYKNNVQIKSLRFRENKNLASLTGDFFINTEKNGLDENKKWNLNFSIQNMNLEMIKPFLPNVNNIEGKSNGEIYVRGTPNVPVFYGDFKIANGELDYPSILKKPLIINSLILSLEFGENELKIKNLFFKKNKTEISSSGVLPWNYKKETIDSDGNILFKLRFINLDLEELQSYFKSNDYQINGTSSLNLNVSGKFSSPNIEGEVNIKSPHIIFSNGKKEIKMDNFSANFKYNNKILKLEKIQLEKNAKIVSISGYFPIDYANKKVTINKNANLSINLSSPGFDLQNFSSISNEYVKELFGEAVFNLIITGSIDKPEIVGKFFTKNIHFNLIKPDLHFKNFTCNLSFNKNLISLEKIACNIDNNSLEINGELDITKKEKIFRLANFQGKIKSLTFTNSGSKTQIIFTEKETQIKNFSLNFSNGGNFNLFGIISKDKNIDLKINLKNIDLNTFDLLLSKKFDLSGNLNSRIFIKGFLNELSIDSNFWVDGGISKELRYEKISGSVNLISNVWNIKSLNLINKDQSLYISGIIPTDKEIFSIHKDKNIFLELSAKSLDLNFISLLSEKLEKSKSDIDFNIKINGSKNDLKINGPFNLKFLSLDLKQNTNDTEKNNISIKNLNGEWKDSRIILSNVKIQYNKISLTFSGENTLKNNELIFNISKIEGVYDKYNFNNSTRLSGNISSEKFQLNESKFFISDGEITLEGYKYWKQSYNFKVSLDKFDLNTISNMTDYKKEIFGKLKIQTLFKSNENNENEIEINYIVKDGKYKKIEIGDIFGKIILKNNVLTLSPLMIKKDNTISKIEGSFPLSNDIGVESEFSCKVNLNNINLELAELFAVNIQELKGNIDSNFSVIGTYSSPQMDGYIKINDGELFLPAMKKKFYKINTKLELDKNKILFNKAQAKIGDGIIEINGETVVGKGVKQNFNLNVSVNNWFFIGLPDLKALINGEMKITGNLKRLKIQGNFVSEEAFYTKEFEEVSIVDSLIDRKIEESDFITEYEIEAIIPKNGKVSNRDVKAEVKGTVFYREKERGKFFTGKLTVMNGTYTFNGKSLKIITEPEYNSYLEFLPEDGKVIPKFHFLARYIGKYQGKDKTVEVKLEGNSESPKIIVYSPDGSLKDDDVIPFIQFGYIPSLSKDNDNMQNRPEYKSLAIGLWADRLVFNALERKVEENTGLDSFQVESGISDKGEYELGVKLGKYLAPNLYVSYSSFENRKVGAEYQLNKFWKITTDVDDKGTKNVDLKFKVRY